VHINSGVAALVTALGDRPEEGIQWLLQSAGTSAADGSGRGAAVVRLVRVHAGSALSAGPLAASAFVVTNTAAAARA